jgi:hypothetical protein
MQYIAYWGGHNSFVFMGDSRIHQIFTAFAKHVSPRSQSSNFGYEDIQIKEASLKLDVQFLWRPILNSSVSVAYQSWIDKPEEKRPKMIITGCGTWSIRENNASMKSLQDFKTNLTRLISSIDTLGASGSHVLWVLQDEVIEENLPPESAMITNDQIYYYNMAAVDSLRYATSEGVHVWMSSRLISEYGYDRGEKDDGLTMNPLALEYSVQILLNMYCNNQMNFNDGTCCSDPEAVTGLQILTFCAFFVISVGTTSLVIYRKILQRKYENFTLLVDEDDDPLREPFLQEIPSSSQESQNLTQSKDLEAKSYYELLTCLSKLGLIMAYAFLCDRTNFFMKENKYYTAPNFFLPIAYVFGLGLFFTEESKHTRVMHRDQTDEWKGWMQLVILTYQMTGANQVLPIYINVRLLVSTYLFLLGFGHFMHYWQRGDQGFHRLWQVSIIKTIVSRVDCLSCSWDINTSRSIGRTKIIL